MTKTAPDGEPLEILLVEDEPVVRMIAADVLFDAGYRVVDASDADEALRLLNLRADLQVLVTDVKMPGKLSGIELAAIVAGRWPDMGIVVASGHAQPRSGDLPIGAIFLPKPYYPSELVDAVASLTARPRKPDTLISVEAAVITVPDPVAPEPITVPIASSEIREKDGEAEA